MPVVSLLQVIDANPNIPNMKDLVDYLDRCLHMTSDMVVMEAARVLCALKSVCAATACVGDAQATATTVAAPLAVLKAFLNSDNETTVCASIRTIARVCLLTYAVVMCRRLCPVMTCTSVFTFSIV